MVRFIILLIILVLALSYFGISIRHIAESPTGMDNFSYVWNFISEGWTLIVTWISGVVGAVMHVFN